MWRTFSVDVRHEVRSETLAEMPLRRAVQLRFPSDMWNTCVFGHQERDMVVMVHGDDFVSSGDLRWLGNMLKENVEFTTDNIGHNEQVHPRQWSGYRHELDVRHSEMIREELGLQGGKTLSTPVSDTHHESRIVRARGLLW